MSDHPREAERCLKKINVSDDVWLGVFAFVRRAELGLNLAIVSDRFDALVDLHLKTRKWTIGKLEIQQAHDGNCAEIFKPSKSFTYESCPIPQQPLPTNVIGFERICIRYIDQNVIAFLHRIQRLFDAHFVLTLEYYSNNEAFWDAAIAEIWPLFMSKLGALSLDNAGLPYFRSSISPTILRDCTDLRSINSTFLFPEEPADDRNEATAGQALSKWLHTAREDGQSKLLKCCTWAAYPKMVEKLKMAFLCALTPVSYIINLRCDEQPFELDNVQTRERLALRHNEDNGLWLLMRYPIGKYDQQWVELKQQSEISLEIGDDEYLEPASPFGSSSDFT